MRQPPNSVSITTAPLCDCESDPIACLEQMFVEMVQMGRIQQGQCPARRPVFLRLHGVAHGRLEIVPDLPENLRVGLFSKTASFINPLAVLQMRGKLSIKLQQHSDAM